MEVQKQARGVNKKRDKIVDRIIELVDKMIAPGYMKTELIDKINELERLAQKVTKG